MPCCWLRNSQTPRILKLETTYKIIKSHCCCSTPMSTTKPCLHPHILECFQRWWLHPCRVVSRRLPWEWKFCIHWGCSTDRYFPFCFIPGFWPCLVCRGEQVFNFFLCLPLASFSGWCGESLECAFYLELSLKWSLLSLAWSALETTEGHRMSHHFHLWFGEIWSEMLSGHHCLSERKWDHVVLTLWDGLFKWNDG